MKVDILDVGSGNIQSIKNWIERTHVTSQVVSSPSEIRSELLILPGVGSASSYMHRLRSGQYDEAIYEHLAKGRRLMGICLGFQLMTNYSEEDGYVKGLGLIDAHVERLKGEISNNGWEPLQLHRDHMNGQSFHPQQNLTKKRVLKGRVFYNHEYGVVNNEKRIFSVSVSDSLARYSGLLVKDKIIGIQFHPEKSQLSGLDLISMIL